MTIWDAFVDSAQILTAVSAVVAVLVATWLGLKAIRVAKADNGQAQQEFLYRQVEGVLESALALTSAASDLDTGPTGNTDGDQRALHRKTDAFQSRIRVLKALKLITAEPEVANRIQHFADALVKVALARQELRCQGLQVLLPTVFDDTDDITRRLLLDLAERLHGAPAHTDELGREVKAFNGLGFSEASDGSPSVAAMLREKVLDRVDRSWTINESLRLVLPWLRVRLGWLLVHYDEENEPLQLIENDSYSGRYFNQQSLEVVEPPRPWRAVEDWLDEWPRRFWNWDENGLLTSTPQEITDRLLRDITAEFLDRLLELIADLREGLPEVTID